MIRVELSERRRVSGDRFAVAACSIAEVEGTAAPICGLARELLRLGIDPNTSLSIWREEVRCFVDATVGRWAELTVKEGSSGTVFRPYMPFSAWDAPSQARESDD